MNKLKSLKALSYETNHCKRRNRVFWCLQIKHKLEPLVTFCFNKRNTLIHSLQHLA